MPSPRQDRQDAGDDLDMERIARMADKLYALLSHDYTSNTASLIVIAATPELARKVLS